MATTTRPTSLHLWRRARLRIDAHRCRGPGRHPVERSGRRARRPGGVPPMPRTAVLDDSAVQRHGDVPGPRPSAAALARPRRPRPPRAPRSSPGSGTATSPPRSAEVMWGEGIPRQLTTSRTGAPGAVPIRCSASMVVDSAMGFYLGQRQRTSGATPSTRTWAGSSSSSSPSASSNYTQADVVAAPRRASPATTSTGSGTLAPVFYPRVHDHVDQDGARLDRATSTPTSSATSSPTPPTGCWWPAASSAGCGRRGPTRTQSTALVNDDRHHRPQQRLHRARRSQRAVLMPHRVPLGHGPQAPRCARRSRWSVALAKHAGVKPSALNAATVLSNTAHHPTCRPPWPAGRRPSSSCPPRRGGSSARSTSPPPWPPASGNKLPATSRPAAGRRRPGRCSVGRGRRPRRFNRRLHRRLHHHGPFLEPRLRAGRRRHGRHPVPRLRRRWREPETRRTMSLPMEHTAAQALDALSLPNEATLVGSPAARSSPASAPAPPWPASPVPAC